MTDRVDWPSLAGLAMTRLGWTPDTFWAATPADLMMAIRALGLTSQPTPLGRSEFASLCARFPDAGVDPRRDP